MGRWEKKNINKNYLFYKYDDIKINHKKLFNLIEDEKKENEQEQKYENEKEYNISINNLDIANNKLMIINNVDINNKPKTSKKKSFNKKECYYLIIDNTQIYIKDKLKYILLNLNNNKNYGLINKKTIDTINIYYLIFTLLFIC